MEYQQMDDNDMMIRITITWAVGALFKSVRRIHINNENVKRIFLQYVYNVFTGNANRVPIGLLGRVNLLLFSLMTGVSLLIILLSSSQRETTRWQAP
jgi:hypothetical protein